MSLLTRLSTAFGIFYPFSLEQKCWNSLCLSQEFWESPRCDVRLHKVKVLILSFKRPSKFHILVMIYHLLYSVLTSINSFFKLLLSDPGKNPGLILVCFSGGHRWDLPKDYCQLWGISNFFMVNFQRISPLKFTWSWIKMCSLQGQF